MIKTNLNGVVGYHTGYPILPHRVQNFTDPRLEYSVISAQHDLPRKVQFAKGTSPDKNITDKRVMYPTFSDYVKVYAKDKRIDAKEAQSNPELRQLYQNLKRSYTDLIIEGQQKNTVTKALPMFKGFIDPRLNEPDKPMADAYRKILSEGVTKISKSPQIDEAFRLMTEFGDRHKADIEEGFSVKNYKHYDDKMISKIKEIIDMTTGNILEISPFSEMALYCSATNYIGSEERLFIVDKYNENDFDNSVLIVGENRVDTSDLTNTKLVINNLYFNQYECVDTLRTALSASVNRKILTHIVFSTTKRLENITDLLRLVGPLFARNILNHEIDKQTWVSILRGADIIVKTEAGESEVASEVASEHASEHAGPSSLISQIGTEETQTQQLPSVKTQTELSQSEGQSSMQQLAQLKPHTPGNFYWSVEPSKKIVKDCLVIYEDQLYEVTGVETETVDIFDASDDTTYEVPIEDVEPVRISNRSFNGSQLANKFVGPFASRLTNTVKSNLFKNKLYGMPRKIVGEGLQEDLVDFWDKCGNLKIMELGKSGVCRVYLVEN